MIVEVGDLRFGWGKEVRDLPANDAYGTYIMSPETERDLAISIRRAGWVPSWRTTPTERVVFLCNPEANWRQPVGTKATRGQFLQVVEEVK